jgi:hypothetical protein
MKIGIWIWSIGVFIFESSSDSKNERFHLDSPGGPRFNTIKIRKEIALTTVLGT